MQQQLLGQRQACRGQEVRGKELRLQGRPELELTATISALLPDSCPQSGS